MKFCKICDNMLYMSFNETNENIELKCRNCCNTDETITSEACLYKNHSDETMLYLKSLVNKFTPMDPTLPHSHTIICPTCKNTTNPDVVFLKYNKKEMKYLYVCCDPNCLTVWKTPSYEQSIVLFQML
jgi:hypothetical protein